MIKDGAMKRNSSGRQREMIVTFASNRPASYCASSNFYAELE